MLALCLTGCAPGGAGGRSSPTYRGLQDQSVAVMVWVERGIRTDFPPIQVDLPTAVQRKLRESQAREIAGATFPVDPRSIVRFQQEHPLLQRAPITDIAPRFNVSRLIYIEVDRFETRSPAAAELFRGSASATLKVVEVLDGQARVVHEEADIQAVFPPDIPQEGMPGGNDYQFYLGTVDRLSDEIARRFIPMESRR